MGIIFSRFRKKKTTIQVLESLEKDIMLIEEYLKITEFQERRVVGNLVLYSTLVYIIVVVIYYLCFASKPVRENFLYFIPLLVYPVVIVLLRRVIIWFYRRKTENNSEKLLRLKSSKKQIVDEVMDKETYKTAKEILEKYAPEHLNRNMLSAKPLMKSPYYANRNNQSNNVFTNKRPSSSQTMALVPLNESPRNVEEPIYEAVANVSFQSQLSQPKFPLARPILARDRTPFDKLVDLLIGDGPSSRYALICRTCCAHNGMALKHEFEYLAFRCAYCLQFNPARKQKPQGPSLSHDDDDNEGVKLYTIDHDVADDSGTNDTTDADDKINIAEDIESCDEKDNDANVTEEDGLKKNEVEISSANENCELSTTNGDGKESSNTGTTQIEQNPNFDMSSLQNVINDIHYADQFGSSAADDEVVGKMVNDDFDYSAENNGISRVEHDKPRLIVRKTSLT